MFSGAALSVTTVAAVPGRVIRTQGAAVVGVGVGVAEGCMGAGGTVIAVDRPEWRGRHSGAGLSVAKNQATHWISTVNAPNCRRLPWRRASV